MKLYILMGLAGLLLGFFLVHLWIGPSPSAAQAVSQTHCSAVQTLRLYATGDTSRIDAAVQAAETGKPVHSLTCGK